MKKEDALALLDAAKTQTVDRPPSPDEDRTVRLLIAVIATMPAGVSSEQSEHHGRPR
jgi:hypothetical protein